MPESGFAVETTLPFAWRRGPLPPGASHGSLLMLRVANLLDTRDPEQDRVQERVEARLDLMLHWLGRQLFGQVAIPDPTSIRLEADRIEWTADKGLDAGDIVLDLYIHPALAAPLQLAARIAGWEAGRIAAELRFESEELSDAWTQWLFRCHRRAVHEARSRDEPAL